MQQQAGLVGVAAGGHDAGVPQGPGPGLVTTAAVPGHGAAAARSAAAQQQHAGLVEVAACSCLLAVVGPAVVMPCVLLCRHCICNTCRDTCVLCAAALHAVQLPGGCRGPRCVRGLHGHQAGGLLLRVLLVRVCGMHTIVHHLLHVQACLVCAPVR